MMRPIVVLLVFPCFASIWACFRVLEPRFRIVRFDLPNGPFYTQNTTLKKPNLHVRNTKNLKKKDASFLLTVEVFFVYGPSFKIAVGEP